MRAPFVAPSTLLSALWNDAADLHPMTISVGMIEENRWANLVVWDTDRTCFWYRSIAGTHNGKCYTGYQTNYDQG